LAARRAHREQRLSAKARAARSGRARGDGGEGTRRSA
jgi:hypothetical protein